MPHKLESDRCIPTLCALIRRGDEETVRTFYNEWFDTLLAWSRTYIPSDEHLALDIVQETMIRVIRSLPILASHAALVAWLRTTTRSEAIDLLRRRIASRSRDIKAAKSEISDSHPCSRANVLPSGAQIDLLAQALSRLSPDDQLLLRLRADSSASFNQLTPLFGGTAHSLYGRARRALERLYDLLAEDRSNV